MFKIVSNLQLRQYKIAEYHPVTQQSMSKVQTDIQYDIAIIDTLIVLLMHLYVHGAPTRVPQT